MKTVFSNRELPHIWALQKQSNGRGAGSIFFEGATIYSYGKHFPIATIEGDNVLFTLRGYSNTTAKHISKARQAISHKTIIWCYEVPIKYYNDPKPLNKQSFTSVHEKNFSSWKAEIKALFNELGNKRNRPETRIAGINHHIELLNKYAAYFGIKITDPELKSLIKLSSSPDFINTAREAKAKAAATHERKVKQASKAYDLYLDLWRKYDTEGLKNLPAKTKELINFHSNNTGSFTRLRFNTDQNRVETSKGVQIPAEIAKRAYKQLNGCMEGECKGISVPVMDYTITETGKDYIKAGCHTIPKADVLYIANLLNW